MAEEKEEKGTEKVEESTLTPEEQMETLRTQLAEANVAKEKAEALAEEKEKGFKSVQRQLSAKKPMPQSSSPQAQALQEVISAMETQAREVGDMSPTTQAKLNVARQHLAAVEQQASYERQDAVTIGVTDDLRNELIEAGVDPDNSNCDGVWDAIQIAKISDGNFDNAKKRASRIITGVKPKEEKKEPEPTEEQVQVAARKMLVKEGKLKNTEGLPSGAGTRNFTREQIRNMPMEEYIKNRDAIQDAYKGDRIK